MPCKYKNSKPNIDKSINEAIKKPTPIDLKKAMEKYKKMGKEPYTKGKGDGSVKVMFDEEY